MKKHQIIPVLLIATLLPACSTTQNPASMSSAQPVAMTSQAFQLHQGMRELWSDHVIWTRDYIVAALNNDPGASAVLDRLMRNQGDIGNAMAPYYGEQTASQLTQLLKDHISIAGELVAAAKANDQAKLSDADRRWHQNAEQLATFLSGANPNWKRADLLNMLNQHLALTTNEATLRLQQKWSEDTVNFDKIFDQAMMMADALSNGVIKQFPARF